MIDAVEIAKERGLNEDAAWFLDFVNKVPLKDRKPMLDVLLHEIFTYIAAKQAWKSAASRDLGKIVKDTKRLTTASQKKRIDIAAAFLADITSPLLLTGEVAENTISHSAKLEIYRYIKILQEEVERDTLNASLNAITPHRPSQLEIKNTVRAIHQKYNIGNLDYTIKGLLPLL